MSAGISTEPITALIADNEDTLFFEYLRLETRMSDTIFGDPLNLSDEDDGEENENEIDWSGTVWG